MLQFLPLQKELQNLTKIHMVLVVHGKHTIATKMLLVAMHYGDTITNRNYTTIKSETKKEEKLSTFMEI